MSGSRWRGAALYPVEIRHVRPFPIRHEFTYRSYQWLIDLDDVPALPHGLRWLAAFRPIDHIGDPAGTLRGNIDSYLAKQGIALGRGRIVMLANARIVGYVFNPISVYWCHDAGDRLVCVIAEVHNTYGQRHLYLLRTDERGRAAAEKEFYVSPFYAVEGRYRMSLPEPDERLAISITMHAGSGPPFVATMRGLRRRASIPVLLGLSVRHPLATLAVSARIRKQGITLWLKGLRSFARPAQETEPPMSNVHPVRVHGMDPDRWPDVAAVPRRPLHAAVAGVLFRAAVRMLAIRVVGPDGHETGRGGATAPVLRLRRPRDFYARVGTAA